jgi:hypothetical protein
MKTVKKMLKLGTKSNIDLKRKMDTDEILRIMNTLMTRKVIVDINCSNDKDIMKRRP